jgi:class 3 adenylate cyclase/tetratricopeptide (TPR) repeat protein
MVNPAGMRFCGGCGKPLIDTPAERSPDVAQRRHMTVMFCDLVGSTPLAEALDPEDLRDVLRLYQHAAAGAIERYDGYLARYLGDGILVYFGYPRAHEDDARRAVHAGLGIIDAMTDLNHALEARYHVTLHARIGVHTGLVVAGEMGGGETRDELAIVGETPNIAARIESIADTDSVAISDSTLALVEEYFETTPMDERALKGVSRAVRTFKVLRATGIVDRVDVTAPGRASEMIGRAAELDRVQSAWQRVRGGDGAIAHIHGEPGIGKSLFVRALRDRLGDDVAGVQVWRCSAYHQNSTLFPIVTHLERTFGIDVEHRDATATHAISTAVRNAGLDEDEAVPVLAALMEIPSTTTAERDLAARDARADTLRVLEQLLVTNATEHPLLLVVEDLHWADPTTIDLLIRVTELVPSHPVLAAFTFRPDFSPPWSERTDVLDVGLRPLSTDDVFKMVAAVGTALDEAVIARVVDVADGVPLFIEEMLKMAAGSGASAEAVAVPTTLRSLLTERLDTLPELRAIIDAAAVVGRDVSCELLSGLSLLSGADVVSAVQALVANDVLRPATEGPVDRYEFSHGLLQEAAYDSMLRSHRQGLHRDVARVLVERFPARTEREPELVARHFVSGGLPDRSIPFWRAAGMRALERAAFIEAAGHFERGVEALDADESTAGDDSARSEFLSHFAASLQAGQGYAAPGVAEAYARARTACVRAGRDDRLASAVRGEWLFRLLRADYDTAFDLATEMLDLCYRTRRPEDLAEGHLLRGMVHMYRGVLEASRSDFETAIDMYSPPDTPDRVYEAQGDTGVMAMSYLAPVLMNLGYLEESMKESDASLALAEHVGGPVTIAQAWGMRTLLLLGRDDAGAAPWAERTLAHSTQRNIPYWKHLSEMMTGWLRGRGGDVRTGIGLMESALSRYLDSGARLGFALFRSMLADLCLMAGDHADAMRHVSEGEAFIEETNERYNECGLLLAKARVLAKCNETDESHTALVRAVDVAREQRARLLELRAVAFLTAHEEAAGAPRTEITALKELVDRFPADAGLADLRAARALLARS